MDDQNFDRLRQKKEQEMRHYTLTALLSMLNKIDMGDGETAAKVRAQAEQTGMHIKQGISPGSLPGRGTL